MKKTVFGVIAVLFLSASVSATNWSNDEDWSNFSETSFEWEDDWLDDPFFTEEPKFPEITVKEPKLDIEEPKEPAISEEKKADENESERFSGNLSFQDQVLSNGTVTVEDLNTGQKSTLIVTYEDEGELVVAGLDNIEEVSSEDVDVSIEDAGGFPGEHTAHVIATEELSGEYEIGDNVSEETSESILDSETANITEEIVQPTGGIEFNDQSLSDNSTVVVENVSSGQNSTLVLTYLNDSKLTIAGLESADDAENRNIEVDVEDAGGFPGNHTAHIIPDEGLSSEYSISDNVSEETASNIIESETALVQ